VRTARCMPDARTLIVTGASSGIGRVLAVASARAGYRVVMIARRAAPLEETARSIRDAGGACAVLAGDVTAPDMPARIISTALHEFGRIDVLVNNAGRGAHGPLLDESDAAIEAQWQLHVAAPLRIARAALPYLEATRGQLVFIGSGIARVPVPSYGAYPLAKAAARAAATQLRRELRACGIAVTYVDPGVVATEFHSTIGVERPSIAASAEPVVRAILRGIERRRAVVNATGWQSALTTLAEWSGSLADRVIVKRFQPQRISQASAAPPTCHPEPPTCHPEPPTCHPEPFDSLRSLRTSSVEGSNEPTSFERALEPVARRMERVKLSPVILSDALVPGATLELNALAMRWAGMPNKNERAVLYEALDALATGGFLERTKEETWRVIRAAD
jgi:short-subunit dehydrogenase